MFKLLRDFTVEEFFSYELLNARKEEYWVPTSYLQEKDKIRRRVFLSYESLKSRKRRIFLPTSYIQGQVRESQGSRWVRQGWSIATKRGREKVKKKNRKEKDQGRQEGGFSKGKSPCALHQELLILVHKYLGLEAARLGWSIGSYETWSTRKQCAKEVPEMDYFTQQKQYLKRTTSLTYSAKAVP